RSHAARVARHADRNFARACTAIAQRGRHARGAVGAVVGPAGVADLWLLTDAAHGVDFASGRHARIGLGAQRLLTKRVRFAGGHLLPAAAVLLAFVERRAATLACASLAGLLGAGAVHGVAVGRRLAGIEHGPAGEVVRATLERAALTAAERASRRARNRAAAAMGCVAQSFTVTGAHRRPAALRIVADLQLGSVAAEFGWSTRVVRTATASLVPQRRRGTLG